MASAVAPPTTPKVTTSVDPIYAAAIAQAKAALAAQAQPIRDQQAASDAQFKQQETDSTGVAAALSKLLQPIGPAVSGMYDTAAQNQELAANGFSAGMQDALKGNTDNLNATLKSLGQNVQLDSHAGQAGDVLYSLGGFNPGRTFEQSGAAFGSAAELQAGDAILKGQDQVKTLKGQAIVADQGFQNKLSELAAKLPGDAQTNYLHLRQLALSDAKFREQVAKDKIDAAYKGSELKLAQLKYTTGVSEFNAKQQLSYAKLSNQEFQQNRDYQVKLANLGIAQQRLQQTILKNSLSAANGGLSKSQVSKFNSIAQSIAMSAFNGQTVYSTKGGVRVAQKTPQLTYAEALSNILKKGVPVQIALDTLDRVYPADQRPTPAILAQELGPLDPQALKQVAAQKAAAVGQTDAFNKTTMSGPMGSVSVAPGADRAGMPTQPIVKSFVGLLAGSLGARLTIGTGSNHNRMTLDGNVSDHWTGHAADITSIGGHAFSGTGPGHVDPALTAAGQRALILAGMSPAIARQQQGGLFNLDVAGHRIQIIFNSFQGGNHYNHLHVGVK